ncbi:hypothetical protein F4604DRAFT_1674993 [Suillus subluteus]|nr:hypothetical protein F4604DRAFT_1674993 [Suillus subluteus]
MPPAPEWSSEQLKWLENQRATYSYCYEYDNLLEFWPSLFEHIKAWIEHKRTHSSTGVEYVPLTKTSVSAHDYQVVLQFEESFEEAFNCCWRDVMHVELADMDNDGYIKKEV